MYPRETGLATWLCLTRPVHPSGGRRLVTCLCPVQACGMGRANCLTTTCPYLPLAYSDLSLRAIGLAFLVWGR